MRSELYTNASGLDNLKHNIKLNLQNILATQTIFARTNTKNNKWYRQ